MWEIQCYNIFVFLRGRNGVDHQHTVGLKVTIAWKRVYAVRMRLTIIIWTMQILFKTWNTSLHRKKTAITTTKKKQRTWTMNFRRNNHLDELNVNTQMNTAEYCFYYCSSNDMKITLSMNFVFARTYTKKNCLFAYGDGSVRYACTLLQLQINLFFFSAHTQNDKTMKNAKFTVE